MQFLYFKDEKTDQEESNCLHLSGLPLLFFSLTAPHYLPLALPSMEFIRPTALLLWELIFPNMTETDMQLTPGGLGYKPGLSYMTTFILYHYPSPLAV